MARILFQGFKVAFYVDGLFKVVESETLAKVSYLGLWCFCLRSFPKVHRDCILGVQRLYSGVASRSYCCWAVREGHMSHELIVEALTTERNGTIHTHYGKFFIRHSWATEKTRLFYSSTTNTIIHNIQDKRHRPTCPSQMTILPCPD